MTQVRHSNDRHWPRSNGDDLDDVIVAMPMQYDVLPCADFAGFARLDRTVDRYSAAGDQMLTSAAAIAEAGEFQQLVKLNVFAVEFEAMVWHIVRRLVRNRR